jgi:hypothetical protein
VAPVVIVIVIVAVIAVAVVVARSRRSDDGVEGFRRQIDALSSDARRPTIDRGIADDGETAVSSEPRIGHQTEPPVGDPGLPNGGLGSHAGPAARAGAESGAGPEDGSEAGSEAGSEEDEPDGT